MSFTLSSQRSIFLGGWNGPADRNTADSTLRWEPPVCAESHQSQLANRCQSCSGEIVSLDGAETGFVDWNMNAITRFAIGGVLAVVTLLCLALIVPGTVTLIQALFHSDEVLHEHLVVSNEPRIFGHLEVTTAQGDLVWAIDSAEGSSASTIDYGTVPDGYQQSFPANNPARALLEDERLVVSASLVPDRHFSSASRYAGEGRFLHGVTVSGRGCKSYACADLFRLRPYPVEDGTRDVASASESTSDSR